MKGKIISILIITLFLISSFNVIGKSIEKNKKDSICDICADTKDKYSLDYSLITPNGHGLGLIYSNQDTNSEYKTTLNENLQPEFDWRNHNGEDYTTEIKDQGSCGSCWAFASLAALEAKIKIDKNNPDYKINGQELDLSEQLMVSCCFNCYYRAYSPGLRGCWGATFDETFDFIKNEGATIESDFNYNSYYDEEEKTYIYPYCGEKDKNWKQKRYEITGWNKISGDDDILKQSLIENGPLATTMIIYESFDNYKNGIYQPESGEEPYLLYDRDGNGYFAGHMVTIVGYNDEQNYWICKNSWGTDWGESGWFKIAYGKCGINRFIKNIYGGSDYYSNTAFFTGIKTDPTETENNDAELNYIGSYPYDMGEVIEGERATGMIIIENTGYEELRWDIYFIPSSWVKWHKFTPDEGYIQPGNSQSITIEMTPYTNYAGQTVKELITVENVYDDCIDYEEVPVSLKIKRKSRQIYFDSQIFNKLSRDLLNKISIFLL